MASNKLQKTFHVLNILLLASAIAEIVMAAVIYEKAYKYDLLSSLTSASAEILHMSSGVVVILCAILSSFATQKNISWILHLCGVITFANFIVQIAGFSIIFNSWITSEVRYWMEHSMADYNRETFAKNAWDQIQIKLSCCGVSYPEDWMMYGNGSIPISCSCENGIDNNCESGPYFEVGCLSNISWYIYDLSPGVASLAAAMAVLQLIVGIITFNLARRASKKGVAKV